MLIWGGGATAPRGDRVSSFTRLLYHTQWPPQSVRLLWTSDQPNAETATWQQTDLHALGGIRTHNLSRQATANPHLRPRGHWDQQRLLTQSNNFSLLSPRGNQSQVLRRHWPHSNDANWKSLGVRNSRFTSVVSAEPHKEISGNCLNGFQLNQEFPAGS
jgi:hypothetical protein